MLKSKIQSDVQRSVEAKKENEYVVLTDLFHPFWHVNIDGKPAEIIPAFSIFRAVKVPSGTHHIEFYCEVPYFKTSIAFSLFILFSSIILPICYFKFHAQLKVCKRP